MIRFSTLALLCCLTLSVTESFARKASQRRLPIHFTTIHAAQKGTSNTNPVLAQANYDYALSPAAQLVDSLRLLYSKSRGSAFDFDNLYYDFDNTADDPGNRLLVSSFTDFDSLRTYNPPGSSNYVTTGIRSYDASGRVTRFFEDSSQIVYFSYDGLTGRMVSTITLLWNGSSYDTSIRHNYVYGIYGSVTRDSTFSRNGSAWMPVRLMVSVNGNLSLPAQRSESQIAGSILITTSRSSYVYNAANRPTSIIRQLNIGNNVLRNQAKDSFEYAANNMLTGHNMYAWDTATASWILRSMEIRHLDPIFSQPDSVWMREDDGSGGYDTLIQKLAYNDAGDPVYLRSYDATGRILSDEIRWYYRLTLNNHPNGIGSLGAVKDVFVYPNPAAEVLHVAGVDAGAAYSICDATGRQVVHGVIDARLILPVQALPQGMYLIHLQGPDGRNNTVSFIRR